MQHSCLEQAEAPFAQTAQGGMGVPLFHLAVLYKMNEGRIRGSCSTSESTAEALAAGETRPRPSDITFPCDHRFNRLTYRVIILLTIPVMLGVVRGETGLKLSTSKTLTFSLAST